MRQRDVEQVTQARGYQTAANSIEDVRNVLVAIDDVRKARAKKLEKYEAASWLGAGVAAGYAAYAGCSLGAVVGAGALPLALFVVGKVVYQERGENSDSHAVESVRAGLSAINSGAEFMRMPVLQLWRENLQASHAQICSVHELYDTYVFTLQMLDAQIEQIESTRREVAAGMVNYLVPAVQKGEVRL